MFSIPKMLFLARKNFWIIKTTPAQVLTTSSKNLTSSVHYFITQTETPKILDEKEQ